MLTPPLAALAWALLPTASAELTWDAAYSKARDALTGLTLSDKVGLVTGTGWNNGQCVGNTDAAASIGYPSLCLQDGPLGVRFAPDVTAFTPGIQAASTWDVDLIGQRAGFMAAEARALGVHVLLGPVVGPLGKVPGAGRNWEGFGPDPYLAGRAAAASVRRMQAAGVQATIKHLVANEQEAGRMSMSSNVDDAVLHEMYLAPFYDAVHAGVASAMCSYNRLNGVYACENDELLNKLLKRQMGFRGYVVSDWTAQHSTVNSALAGLDMSMPGSDFSGQGDVYWGPQLISAVQDGSVPERRVDDMATRILAAWYKVQQDEGYPSVDLSRSAQGSHARNVRAVARDGTVLLRNVDGILPLSNDNAGSIAVIGSGAVAGRHANNQCENHACSDGALGMGWGSGVVLYPYFSAPDDAIRARAGDGDRVTVTGTDDPGAGAAAAGAADVSIVFITANAGEDLSTPVEGNAADRNNLDPWHGGNELVAAVAEASDNVIVVAHSPGPLDLSSILSHPSVKAVVWAGMPSQENGNALADILWGDANPSGKLVYTIAKNADDYNTGVVGGDDSFPERLNVDYRYFDSADVEPEFEFGFGLSYTNFSYSDLEARSTAASGPIDGPIVSGGPRDLYDEVANVTAEIANSGGVQGAEVAQLYLAYPSSAGQPPKQLRGFDKLPLEAGESRRATFSLRKKDLAVWDAQREQWVIPSGTFEVLVGASSRDIRLRGGIEVT